jgi:hypothetical protein
MHIDFLEASRMMKKNCPGKEREQLQAKRTGSKATGTSKKPQATGVAQ